MAHEWQRDGFVISTDKRRIDLDAVKRLIDGSYWAAGRPLEQIQRTIEHSLVFGVYRDGQQIGYARVVTDYVSCAYLADVLIDPDMRGHGLGGWLIETILAHPDLADVRRWLLITRDAQELYRKFGFREVDPPERYMERIAGDQAAQF